MLTGWSDDDADELAAIGSVDVVRYLGGTPWTTRSALDSIQLWRQIERRLGITTWAVRLRQPGQTLIGTCGFAGTNVPWLRADAVIEIGWTVRRPWWRQGYATEAAELARDVALRRYPSERLLSKCHVENAASEAVMRRIGMRRVGLVQGAWPAPTLVYRF